MDITSIVYILFLGITLIIYWIVPKKIQWFVLTGASLVFYFLNAEAYTIIYVLISVLTIWWATRSFEKVENAKKKKVILIITLLFNFGILAALKYTNLAINTINILLECVGDYYISNVTWLAPIAISFYTLQIVSYLLDAYWGVTKIQRNPVKLFLYTTYFPLMVSGPINTHNELGTQLFEEHRFDYERVSSAMKRIALGLVKKMAISGRLAIIVDGLWDNLTLYHGIWVWIAVAGYVLQLYTDFSGCMDIVIGTSECFGIKVAENFNAPLLSKSTQEFWQRWHITLGQWLRNYIMNPLLKSNAMTKLGDWSKKHLGKKKGKKVPVYLSMLVLWLAMGIWHGDSWKYILGEGLWFWLVIVLGQILATSMNTWKQKLRIKDGHLWKAWQIIRTNIIFAVGMLFFRSSSLSDSFVRIKESIGWNFNVEIISTAIKDVVAPVGKTGCIVLVTSIVLLVIYDVALYKGTNLLNKLSEQKLVTRWLVYIVMITIICLSYNLGDESFAYAQF